MKARSQPVGYYFGILLCIAGMTGCSGASVDVQTDFPVPLVEQAPVKLGLHLDDELTSYVHTEKLEKRGNWKIGIGDAQMPLFTKLADGLFENYELVERIGAVDGLDGTLHPTINEIQFSIPAQTRTKYFEVWIRYKMKLYDRVGNLVTEWDLPAYGKANDRDHLGSASGLEAAALAACRDAIAFLSLNFSREKGVQQWLADGKPIVPPAPAPAPAPAEETTANNGDPSGAVADTTDADSSTDANTQAVQTAPGTATADSGAESQVSASSGATSTTTSNESSNGSSSASETGGEAGSKDKANDQSSTETDVAKVAEDDNESKTSPETNAEKVVQSETSNSVEEPKQTQVDQPDLKQERSNDKQQLSRLTYLHNRN